MERQAFYRAVLNRFLIYYQAEYRTDKTTKFAEQLAKQKKRIGIELPPVILRQDKHKTVFKKSDKNSNMLYMYRSSFTLIPDRRKLENDFVSKKYIPPDGDSRIFFHAAIFYHMLEHRSNYSLIELARLDLAMLKFCCKLESRIGQIEKKGIHSHRTNKSSDTKAKTKKEKAQRSIEIFLSLDPKVRKELYNHPYKAATKVIKVWKKRYQSEDIPGQDMVVAYLREDKYIR